MTRAPLPIDWPAVLAVLLQAEAMGRWRLLARRIELPRRSLQAYHAGATLEPGHHHGEVIVSAWMKATRQPREALPRRTAGPG